MYLNPYNAGLLTQLLGDSEVEELFSSEQMLKSFAQFEIALARALSEAGLISHAACDHICQKIKSFKPDRSEIETQTAKDGMPAPEFVRQIRDTIDEPHKAAFHLGSTSQDLIDTALMMALSEYSTILWRRLNSLQKILPQLATRFGHVTLQGRTRMQAAKTIRVCDRIRVWSGIVDTALAEFASNFGACMRIQLAGPVGNRKEWGKAAEEICACMAEDLGLDFSPHGWHTDRSALVNLASWCVKIAGGFGKIGIDLALMAQMNEVKFQGGGSSSAMPHKVNPVDAETLVAISYYVSTLSSGMNLCLVHEQERSGSMWTLEWMIFPQICTLTAKSSSLLEGTLSNITHLGKTEVV